jgi:integrase
MNSNLKLDLPHLVTDSDRHGNVRVYVRVKGRPKVRIRAAPGSPAFLDAYRAAVDGVGPQRRISGERRPELHRGTIGWLAHQYFSSTEFQRGLELQTQRTRRAIIEQCLSETVRPGSPDIMGDCPLQHFGAAHIRRLRDFKAERPGAARNRVKALRVMFAWGIERGHCEVNPARDVRAQLPRTAGFHSWTPEEIKQFEDRHPIGTRARLAMSLLAFTGQRRGDIVTFGRQHVREEWLTFVQRKGRKHNPEAMSIPLLPELRAILDASETGDLTFLVTSHGLAYSAAGFGNRFRQWCDEAGLRQCSAHGLRKAGATIAAERGATDAQLMAIFGWSKAEMAAHYRRAANQRSLAESALRLLGREQTPVTKSPTTTGIASHSWEKPAKSTR